MAPIQLILVDPDSTLCGALKGYFKDLPNVEVVNDRYAEPGQSLNGTTGTVAGAGPNSMVTIHTNDGRSLGFGAEELEHH